MYPYLRKMRWRVHLSVCILFPCWKGLPCSSYQVSMRTTTHGENLHGSSHLDHRVQRGIATRGPKVNIPAREPAGIESFFSMPKHQRQKESQRDPSRDGMRRFDRLRIIRGRLGAARKKRRYRESDNVDVWRIEETRASLVDKWACENVEEEQRLAAMKMLVQDSFLNLKGGSRPDTQLENVVIDPVKSYPDVYGDTRLLRFLRKDEKQDPVSAAMRFREFLHWRSAHSVDRIRSAVEVSPFVPPESLSAVSQFMPCKVGTDRAISGDLLALLHVGSWDTAGLTRAIKHGHLSLPQFLDYWTYLYESIHRQLYLDSVEQQNLVFLDEVCDLSGLHMAQFTPSFVSGVLKPWLRLTQHNYPETTRKIIFLEPPHVLNLAWKIVTPMVSEGTVNKVKFCRGYKGSPNDFVAEAKTREIDQLVSSVTT